MTRLALALVAALCAADAPAGEQEKDRALVQVARESARAHREADALAGEGKPAQAAQVVEKALSAAFPGGEEAWQLRADLLARLSQLKLQAGDAVGALGAARRGVAEARGRPASMYVAQLWLRFGEALEHNGEDGQAVDAYQSAIEVAKQVLAARQDAGRQP